MCSYSIPGHVHVSQDTYSLLAHRFSAVCRGESTIKGKGIMKTYFLVSLPAGQREILLEHRTAQDGPAAGDKRSSNELSA